MADPLAKLLDGTTMRHTCSALGTVRTASSDERTLVAVVPHPTDGYGIYIHEKEPQRREP